VLRVRWWLGSSPPHSGHRSQYLLCFRPQTGTSLWPLFGRCATMGCLHSAPPQASPTLAFSLWRTSPCAALALSIFPILTASPRSSSTSHSKYAWLRRSPTVKATESGGAGKWVKVVLPCDGLGLCWRVAKEWTASPS